MIDFRYHLVSLIAVFLAIALGIVIGTTALNQPLLADIKGQVSKLEADKRGLEDQTRALQSEVNQAGAFESAVAPALVGGTLTGRKVLLLVTDDKVPGDTVDKVSTLVGQAGGSVSGTLHLQSQYSDPAEASAIQNYATGAGLPSGVTLPPTGDSKQLVAALLADVLMVPNGRPAGAGNAAAISSVLAGLSALNVLTQDSSSVAPADYAIVLTGAGYTDKNAKTRTTALVDLASALDAAGSGAVVAGDESLAGGNGLVDAVRGNPTVTSSVSTVDDVLTPAGQISAVLALSSERLGSSGKYGTGQDTQPVPPVPGATP